MTQTFEDRSNEAADDFNSDPPNIVQQAIIATGLWLEQVTGEKIAVGRAMLTLLGALGNGQDDTWVPEEWPSHWDDLGWTVGHVIKRGQDITDLMAFGKFGLPPLNANDFADVTQEGRIAAVGARVEELRGFFDSIPKAWADKTPYMAQELSRLEAILLAAEGRFKVDTGTGISAEHLSAMTGLSIRSVRNLIVPSSNSGLHPGEDGLIPADAATRWLADRTDYKSSLWLNREESGAMGQGADESYEIEGTAVFVPVAADNTLFDPISCRRNGSYQIGVKGDERTVEDYHDALSQLARMTKPSWRRPNPKGNWGIVRAQNWVRKSSTELEFPERNTK
tara:strand:+ start:708 stop:1718 length:1011 start_codon:yes stop_codon:yes gene_type:complete